jgi:hypothetical protein
MTEGLAYGEGFYYLGLYARQITVNEIDLTDGFIDL